MIASQTLATLGGLVILLSAVWAERTSRVGPQLAVLSGDAPHAFTEVDHRRIVDARLPPYSAIGKFKGTMTCTAAIVLNPRIIVTAGHCVTERDGTIRQSNLSFQPGYQAGTDLGRFRATIWAVGSRQNFERQTVQDASEDWAILLLDRAPAGVHPFLLSHQSLRAPALLERQILLPAYSNDIVNAEVLSVDPTCTILGSAWDVVVHTCRARPGSSGAPLLLREGQAYIIIGIHAASMFASDEDGRIAKFIGNQAIDSVMFSHAVLTLSRQLDSPALQTANSADY